jgi:DNA primase
VTVSRRLAHSGSGRTPEERRNTVEALAERAAAQAGLLVTGEDWSAWLQLAARLPGWSFTNIMLISAQRPDATEVAGYQEWQAQARQVRKSEPGIAVIAEPPASASKTGRSSSSAGSGAAVQSANRGRRTRVTYVWDIAQTSGPGEDRAMLLTPDLMLPALWEPLTWLARREGFAVDRRDCDPWPGVTNWSIHRIRIHPGPDRKGEALALIHELGHVLAHEHLSVVPGASTAGCHGIHKIEADSIACIVAAWLSMDTAAVSWPSVPSWAGSDARARPLSAVCAAGTRITTAVAAITAHLDTALFAVPPKSAGPVRAPGAVRGAQALGERILTEQLPSDQVSVSTGHAGVADCEPPVADICRVLLDADRFYRGHLDGSWVPGYLEGRGFGAATATQWGIGYAAAGWTVLLSHLRALGHDDAVIEAAGLARRSSRGTLIDHFRDRVMLPIRDEHGVIVGFIGRARPDAGPAVPKYLNSPQTAVYTKGDFLFGLHEAREQLACGAVSVIAEGPFDAIAISAASPGQHAGLAPCGTALTSRQVAALARDADLDRIGVMVALDGDRAGREAAIKAYKILLPVAAMPTTVLLPPERDPAEILQADGPTALSRLLLHQVEPLARVVIDAHLDSWGSRLGEPEGPLRAMRSAAALVASLLPAETADRILQITGGHILATLDANLRPVANAQLPAIARFLPAGAACQIARIADRLDSEYSDVTAEVVNAVSRGTADPGRTAGRYSRNSEETQIGRSDTNPVCLTSVGFPCLSRGAGNSAGTAARPREPPNPSRQSLPTAARR